MDSHAVEGDLDAVGRAVGKRTLMAEELELAGLAEVFIKDFDGADPLLLLAVVDLAQVEDGFLEDAPAFASAVFDDRPIEVLLPSFHRLVCRRNMDVDHTAKSGGVKRAGLHYTRFSGVALVFSRVAAL